MYLTIERNEIFDKLENLQNVVNTRTTLPVSNNVLIETVSDDQVILTANNFEIALGASLPAVIHEPGSTTLSGKKFYEMVREMPHNSEFTLKTSPKHITSIKYDGGNYRLHGINPEEFPAAPPTLDSNNKISVDALQSLLEHTIFAASLEEVRYYLNSIHFIITTDSTIAVSTDARRLAIAIQDPIIETESDDTNFILPLKTAKEIVKVFTTDKQINFSVDEGQLSLTDGEFTLVSRLIEGEYPNYDMIVPKDHSKSITTNKTELINATKRVSLLADPKNFGVQIDFNQSDVVLSVETPDLGTADASVGLSKEYTHQPTRFKFDARLLIDALTQIHTDNVIIEFESSDKIMTLKPDSEHDSSYFNLLMPLRLEDEQPEPEEPEEVEVEEPEEDEFEEDEDYLEDDPDFEEDEE